MPFSFLTSFVISLQSRYISAHISFNTWLLILDCCKLSERNCKVAVFFLLRKSIFQHQTFLHTNQQQYIRTKCRKTSFRSDVFVNPVGRYATLGSYSRVLKARVIWLTFLRPEATKPPVALKMLTARLTQANAAVEKLV